jgi:hypothetical protein
MIDCESPTREEHPISKLNDANRPMHVYSRDSPQSLELWEDGRLTGNVA